MTRISEAEYLRLPRVAGLEPKAKKPPGARRRGVMNSWEKDFSANVLTPMRLKGEIDGWHFEEMRLALYLGSEDVRPSQFTVDFLVTVPNGMPWCIDTKGYRHRDGITKIKSAADKFRCFRWALAEGGPGKWRLSWLG